MAKRRITPTTFLLNEAHELTPSEEKNGNGGIPQYADISWAAKAARISQSLQTVADEIEHSRDPLRYARYFILAIPVAKVKKHSKNMRRAPGETYVEETDFGGAHGRVFDRLGLDLLQVTQDGGVVVHAEKETFKQLRHRANSLESLGQREQARWATIDSFETVPLELRVDASWLQSIRTDEIVDTVIELQPVLAGDDADHVVRAITALLMRHQGERLTGNGRDFSGRYWFRGLASRQSIRNIAKDFYSVQSIHAPLFSIAAGTPIGTTRVSMPEKEGFPPPDTSSLTQKTPPKPILPFCWRLA